MNNSPLAKIKKTKKTKFEKKKLAALKAAFEPSLLERVEFIQLIGKPGCGSRRLALSLAQPAQNIVWISAHWNLYAPLLWKMAKDMRVQLLGIECPKRKKLRKLCQEILEAQVFDAWILDGFHLNEAEGKFLLNLTRLFPLRILVLDTQPRTFCSKRAHLHLSHDSYRLIWSKGAPSQPQFFSTPESLSYDSYF